MAHLYRDELVFAKAKELAMMPEDFESSSDYGNALYKVFAKVIFEIGVAPVTKELMATHVKVKIEQGEINSIIVDQVVDLICRIYSYDLNREYCLKHLKPFIKYRRGQKVKAVYLTDTDRLTEELNKLCITFNSADIVNAVNLHPFRQLVLKSIYSTIGTGLRRLDEKIGGLGLGEYGMIIGFTGGGKTALGNQIACSNAMRGNKSTVCSLEQDGEEIAQRHYSSIFRIPYSELHSGAGNMELIEKYEQEEYAEKKRLLADNLCVSDLKEEAPITANQLYSVLVRKFEEDGFIPKIVVVDQLEFLLPNKEPQKNAQLWQVEWTISKDIDELSHKRIGGERIAVWLLHQAGSNLKKYTTQKDISGYKGVAKPADVVIGIGRDEPISLDFGITTLKMRHGENVKMDYFGNLKYMTFEDPIETNTPVDPQYTHKTNYVVDRVLTAEEMGAVSQLQKT